MRMLRICPVIALSALLVGCPLNPGPCDTNPCDDNDPCTENVCTDVDGEAVCDHPAKDCGDDLCDPDDGACVACLTDADCAEGFCSEGGGNVCVECVTDAHCDDGNDCTADSCNTGTCENNDIDGCCTSDQDCAEGAVCTEGECTGGSGCATDGDCAEGEVCTEGECVPETGCSTDADCAEGEVCTEGECVAGATSCADLTGDTTAGETYYSANGCGSCHGTDPPNITDVDCQTIFDKLSGAVSHVGGTYDVTEQDAADLEAYLGSF